MAYPNAAIYQLDNGEPSLIAIGGKKQYQVGDPQFPSPHRPDADILLNDGDGSDDADP
jgi:hypothetical protein